eukprot:CAMPEP_0114573296 /NCGR_PEP_ID=MMETSP0114-20121206/18790_1 /TAXON_ID=31324 /ORGANISM="Goniomonas sp, Strain m" /LENGTH=119 /DNA_ID=CAMNT_0001760645 /DNA_START=253 /DNA_END=612 /DNA_ORIENTATION=-
MISFGASEVVPVYYVLFTFCSVLAGIILFKEFREPDWWHSVLFIFGCLMTLTGVIFITTIRSGDELARRQAAAGVERAKLLSPEQLWDDDDDDDLEDLWGLDDDETDFGKSGHVPMTNF